MHVDSLTCVPFTCAASEHGGLHGAQRRPLSLVLDSTRQCPTLGLAHCKLGLAMLPALISGRLNSIPCLNVCSVAGACCGPLFPDIHGME